MQHDAIDSASCDACTGVTSETPAPIANAPGLGQVAYRVGTHASFKASMLASLSGQGAAALAGLGSRRDDDPSIALLDGFAVVADVLAFYQERIANEAFLRTATERRSAIELARLIGYGPDPGVAADAWLAFTLEEPRGAPATSPVVVPERTQVQSVPGPDEAPQLFETTAPIEARVERNAIQVQLDESQRLVFGSRELHLAGTGHRVAAGDVILVVGKERRDFGGSERWDLRLVRDVDEDPAGGLTRLRWREGLGSASPFVEPAARDVSVHVFRLRAALFGHNAPDPRLLASTGTNVSALADLKRGTWNGFAVAGSPVDLDQAYPQVVPGSWLALVSDAIPRDPSVSSLPGYAELYQVETVSFPSVASFGLSGKATRVGLDTEEHVSRFGRRDTLVLAGSEPLPLARRPVRGPVTGDRIALAGLVAGLAGDQPLAISGRRQHLRVAGASVRLRLEVDDGTHGELAPDDRVTLLAAPTRPDGRGGRVPLEGGELAAAIDAGSTERLAWRVDDRDGRTGTVEAAPASFVLDPATPDDPVVSEVVRIADTPDGIEDDRDRTTVRLATALVRAYDRPSVRINANVAPATHGETVSEILGSGDAAAPDQRFALRQGPLTWVGAETPSGRRSTLEVRVDDARWAERPTLFAAGPRDRAYALQSGDEGATTVRFGDGAEGARLPTGTANVRARYRRGLGAAGNVQAGQLSTLLSRPLGVSAVVNPLPATGGEDPEPLDGVRRNAPLTVLTLDRVVSRRDYEDQARGFAGIAKANATWITGGAMRGIAITVAGTGATRIEPGSETHRRLAAALRSGGDPLVPIELRPHEPVAFRLAATVRVDPDREVETVLAGVRAAITAAFGFAARDLGQGVSIDEVVAVMHRVAGVVAVDVDALRRADQPPSPAVRPRLGAAVTRVVGGAIRPAELLTVDEARLSLEVMP